MKYNNILKIGFALIIGMSGVNKAYSWGQKGHDVTAHIANRHLTPRARAAVDSLLKGKSLVYYANWADNACHTPQYEYTKTWHYKNIDADKTFENAPNIPEGNIVEALNSQFATLLDPEANADQKWLALVLTTHFCGDIHQPMHMGRATDRGGNRHNIKYFGRGGNLHSTWDSSLVESAHKWSYSEWADNIDNGDSNIETLYTAGQSPYDWGKETYEITCRVYESTPEDTDIRFDYISDWTPIIEEQFLKGGLRLADALNSIFDPDYQPKSFFLQELKTAIKH